MKHSNAVLPTCMVSVVERINWPSERLKIQTHRLSRRCQTCEQMLQFCELKLNRCALSERTRTLKMCLEFCLHFAFMTQICTAIYVVFICLDCILNLFCIVFLWLHHYLLTGFYTSAFLFTAQTSQIVFVSVWILIQTDFGIFMKQHWR